jgi:hypothetical protein
MLFMVSGEDRQVPVYASGIQVSLDSPHLLVPVLVDYFTCVLKMITKIPVKLIDKLC